MFGTQTPFVPAIDECETLFVVARPSHAVEGGAAVLSALDARAQGIEGVGVLGQGHGALFVVQQVAADQLLGDVVAQSVQQGGGDALGHFVTRQSQQGGGGPQHVDGGRVGVDARSVEEEIDELTSDERECRTLNKLSKYHIYLRTHEGIGQC